MRKWAWYPICCFLTGFLIESSPACAQDFAFPRLTFPSMVISTAEEPGPVYTATPGTLFRHDFYTGLRYIHSDFKTYWGMELDEFFGSYNDPLSGENQVKLTHQMLQLAIAYGISDRLLVGTMIPWKRAFFERNWAGSEVREPGGYRDENDGLGDVVLTARYKILEELDDKPFSWAIGMDIKLATGDDRRLRVGGRGVGTGETDYKALTMLSKNFRKGAAYLNLGYNREGRESRLDSLEYNLALVFPLTKRFSISGEFLGVSYVNWESESDFTGLVNPHTLNTYDLGLGVKFIIKGIRVEIGSTYPLNDDYVRTKLQPTCGINYVF